jgi:phosphatidylglycerol:prolipoprotein diacylglycerol transferase
VESAMLDNHYVPEGWGILKNINGISTYSIFVQLAIIIGILTYLILSKIDNTTDSSNKKKHTFNIVIMALLGGFIGSKILVLFENLNIIILDPNNLKLFLISGKSIVGGLIGGFVALTIYKKVNKIEGLRFGNNIAPPVALSMAIGRIGCFLSGCCYGIHTNFLGVDFGDGPRIPTQLIEAFFCFMLFIFLLYKKYKKTNLKAGELFSDLVLYYFIFRFLIEFIRATEKTILFMSIYQIVCIAGIIYMIFRKRKEA